MERMWNFPVLWLVSIEEWDNGVRKAYFHWLGTVRYLEYLLACWPTSPIDNSTVIALGIPERSSLSQPGKACLATPHI
ncbi:hypothetical protein OOU_Y34scaffold00576g24 [Pyricularia oryzae Y34]|uniref:Uncharacterized protein n=2 Tax=Pyricularia oryzae TaxID=318829 RepID=A0AA97NX70_PYRO3|nr:hypothetical protein OOU_Y34scaffold00576g24 [Pyricularia oryzae Y34]